MYKIIAPLKPKMQGEAVAKLQVVLKFLLKKRLLQLSPEQRKLIVRYGEQEADKAVYGRATTVLVRVFQEKYRLEPSGTVDKKTANMLNQLIREFETHTNESSKKTNTVFGKVTNKNGRPLKNLLVLAYDRDLRNEEFLGQCITDKEGRYEIKWQHRQIARGEIKEADISLKVLTRKKKKLLYASTTDGILYNASPREEINITIDKTIEPEVVEYEYLLEQINHLSQDIPVTELQENKHHQDITFLSKELEVTPQKIDYMVVSHRLQAESNIDAAFFYALLRKNTLLKNNLVKSFQTRFAIGINTEILPLLYDAALADPRTIRHDVEAAAKEMIVSAKIAKKCKRNIEQLQQYKKRAEEYYKNEHPRKVLNIINRFVAEDKISEMGKLFQENKNDLNVFFNKIMDDSFFKNNETATEAKTSIALGELLGFDEPIISQVKKSQKITKPEDIKKLAALNKVGWEKVLTESADKINLAGKPMDKKLIGLHASSLARKMEREYPTVAFSAQLAREKKKNTVLKKHKEITDLFTKYEDFDLQHSNIDLFLKKKQLATKENAAMREELKTVQRVFKLVPHYGKTNALLKQNIHSAQGITAIGETRFMKEIAPKAGINTKEAKKIFDRAERTSTAAMLIVGELQDTIRTKDIPALEMKSLSKKLEAVSKDFPNLKSLFQLTDTCECEHCRSVYSPAAYLVEILQFLDKRGVVDLTVTAPPPPAVRPKIKIAKDVLFERRPNLGEIDLSCENANTPVPYIDLVCELLEDAVAPDSGVSFSGVISEGTISDALYSTLTAREVNFPVTKEAQIFKTEIEDDTAKYIEPYYLRDKKVVCKIIPESGDNFTIKRLRQTLSTAQELDAAPEYVNNEAYKTVKDSSFAFKLPFDLDHTEAKAYFSRFNIFRAKLMEDFQTAGDPADEAISAEKLGLTDAEREVIVTPDAANQQKYWNTTDANASEEMKVVDTLLTKSALSYKELDLLLSLKFIDPADNLFIKHLELSCDTEQKEIADLDDAALDRIHRFLWLQKKTGWKFETLDEIISQSRLGNGNLDDECLIKAADLLKLSEETGIQLEELIGFYGEIPHKMLNNDAPKPLYHHVFLNKARNGFIDPRLLLPEEKTGSELLNDVQNSLSVCLQLSEQDFDKIIALAGNITTYGSPTFGVDNPNKFTNLSYLFAASRLIKKLKLKTDDFAMLAELAGLNIFDSPEKTLEFLEAVNDLKKSPLKLADVKFMLRHEATNLVDLEIKDNKITSILEKLQKDYQNNFTANRSAFDADLSAQEQKETLQIALSKLKRIAEEDVKTFTKYIDGSWTNAIAAKIFIDDKLDSLFNTGSIKSAVDELESTLPTKSDDIKNHEIALLEKQNAQNALSTASTPTEIAAAEARIEAAETQLAITLPIYNIATGKNFVEAFLNSIAAYQLYLGKQSILELAISSTFKVDLELVKVVLKYAMLKQPDLGTSFLSDVLLSDDLIDVDIAHTVPVLPAITNLAFADQYRAIRLLHKLVPLVTSFKLGNQDVEWFLEKSTTLGWFEWDSIPYETGQTAIDYGKYAAFTEMIDLSKQLTPVPNLADAEHPVTFFTIAEMLLLSDSEADRDQFIELFSKLTGYSKEDVFAIDEYLFPVVPIWSPIHYRDIKTWRSISDCAEHLRKLGSTVAQVEQYIKPVLTSADTNLLRTALKARYDEDTWLSTLKEIMDAIRPQKRDALVSYLLATNPEMKDENDLYDYFLIDVEMEACMPSSRIVQAHGSIQLFVQRCLMGLEPKAAADVNSDKSWEQWKWMKNYRVWEANRKVFLYPENWIEAELRDDKSFLFTELENELQQNELTEFTAEEALIKYLEKLDNIAFLEVMATWYQSDIKTMHVFARTKGGDPAIYYYRRFEQERYWTPWEKVELDITGDHLLAFVRNNRLSLAWPVFSEETDPDQGATLPDQSEENEQPVDKPRKKLKIQLAISEFANKKWQPKKISKDAIKTPPNTDPNNPAYTDKKIARENLKLFYNELGQQIVVFDTIETEDYEYDEFGYVTRTQVTKKEEIIGAFDLNGCKGYPELAPAKPLASLKPSEFDFLPKFLDTNLINQRYKELDLDYKYDQYGDMTDEKRDDLSVKNGMSFNQFYPILKSTPGANKNIPGTFRITYPHQITKIDIVPFLFQYILSLCDRDYKVKIPLGTLLPYFMEDSNHAYVIIPGFYERDSLNVIDPRTGSDVLQLIEDIVNYLADPAPEKHDNLIDDFQTIMTELKVYNRLKYGEQFKNMYHPLICQLRTILYKNGIPGLMKRETQIYREKKFDFEDHYEPTKIVPKTYMLEEEGVKKMSYPVEDIDFTTDGSYSGYNWELFFHVPLLIASRLTKNQRFEEAMDWFHYMFNPTGALEGQAPEKYWMTKPFYLTHSSDYIDQRIDTLLYKIADSTTPEIKDLEFAIGEWRSKPFKPHVVARFRPAAYQKALLMKYIDNLTEWGDYLFRQDTMESIVQATQMYILADKLLGPKPRIVPPAVKSPYETYNQIEKKLSHFSNALIEFENILPDLSALPEGGAEMPPPPVTLSMLYFCIPQNEKMQEYWDRIADRLFKIRNCQNIEGIERSLALFAPPIDPGMLVRAAAAGLDISSILAGINAPTPYYRFNVLSQKATELVQEVRGLSSSLLQALEKKDAEGMSLLRSDLELKMLNAIKDMKLLQVDEAKEQIEVLKRTKKVTEERYKFYKDIEFMNELEITSLTMNGVSAIAYTIGSIMEMTAGATALIPDVSVGAAGLGGSPVATSEITGGEKISSSIDSFAKAFILGSQLIDKIAGGISTVANYERRHDDWKLQERLAKKELKSIEKQIVASEIRKEIAETDLKNHELQIENAKKTDEFMRSKFTNKELYDWMIGQVSSVYFKSYQLAHDFAKKAERSYRFELGNDDSFIKYGYWDSMKKGLQSADHLLHDIKRMETSYLDKNKREYELTKHVSLSMLDPLALVRLRATGVCDFEIPEAIYDMDHPGQYFRRIKSVSISMPCIVGPYTSVSAKLSLVNNRYRKNTNPARTGYPEVLGNDERFVYNIGAIQSIATGNSQNDSGIFELNFRDERYLPFEGCGAISTWRLELPKEVKQFDYNTISDVILHVKYTAREGGSSLKSLAESVLKETLIEIKQQLNQTGLHIALNMKHDMANEWQLLKKNGTVDMTIDKLRLPYFVQSLDAEIEKVIFIAQIKNNPASYAININATATNLSKIDEWELCKGDNSDIEIDIPFELSGEPAQLANLEDLMMMVKYNFNR